MAIITLDDLKTALGIPASNTTRDAQLTAAVNAASTAVLNYTDRDFGLGARHRAAHVRYDGSGVLDIDDCTAVTAVTLSYNSADTVLSSTSGARSLRLRRHHVPAAADRHLRRLA